ncbi:MAG TPA: TonB-dependent receptor [Rhizomicrobium sp.]|nr:TonB-dependent receptor [Rhizomicrobium sp.]
MSIHRIALKSSVAAATLLCAGALPAFAAEEDAVETVIVTAEKVEQDIQRIPLSVTAFSAQDIEKSHIETLTDVALRTPGFTATAFTPAEPNLTIRGIGSAEAVSQNAGGDPSVVLYMDGVYLGRGGIADIDAYSLERIEVLRGPQGTLYGKNAAGGLVNFITKKADDETYVHASATVGNYSTINGSAQVNVPLTDNLFFAGGVASKNRSGYEYNESTGNHVNDEHVSTVQGQLRYIPSNDLEIILAGDYTHQDQKGNPRHNNCNAALAGGIHCVGINPDPRVVDAYTDGYLRRDLADARFEVNWTTPLGTVTSITAYRDTRLGTLTPFFSNPVNPPAQIESTEIDAEKNHQVSQELRLAFDAMDDRLTGVAGFYFLHEDNNRTETLIQDFPAPSISGTAAYPQHLSARSVAIFGQANYKIFESLTATFGARMTWENKDGEFAGFLVSGATPTSLPPPLSGNYDVTASKSWSAFTPKAALEWQVTDDAMTYFSASRGFKSGGFQGIAGSGISQQTPYDPEYAWSFEVGAKTRWLDNHVQLNGDIFQTNYSGLQISQLIPLVGLVIGNAAEARIRGAELEFVVIPVNHVQLDGSYTYLDTTITKCDPAASICHVGNELTRAPRNKLNFGVQFDQDLGFSVLSARLDYLYTSKYYFEITNIPTQTQDGYSMVDGRIAFTSPNDHWEVALWGKNLNDALVATYITAFAPYGQVLVPYAPPRTFGVTLSFKN